MKASGTGLSGYRVFATLAEDLGVGSLPTPTPTLANLKVAIGNAGVEAMDTSRVNLWLGDVRVIESGGRAGSYTEEAGAAVMKAEEIRVRVDLGRGGCGTTVWTCDYSYDYVKINAEYRT